MRKFLARISFARGWEAILEKLCEWIWGLPFVTLATNVNVLLAYMANWSPAAIFFSSVIIASATMFLFVAPRWWLINRSAYRKYKVPHAERISYLREANSLIGDCRQWGDRVFSSAAGTDAKIEQLPKALDDLNAVLQLCGGEVSKTAGFLYNHATALRHEVAKHQYNRLKSGNSQIPQSLKDSYEKFYGSSMALKEIIRTDLEEIVV